MKEHGLRHGIRSRNGSPLTGRKIAKLPGCRRITVSAKSNYIESNCINDVTRTRVTGNNNMTVVDTNRETFSKKVWYDILRIDDDQGIRQKIVMKDTEESRKKNSFFESIPEKIRL
jgi:hypothetical protein